MITFRLNTLLRLLLAAALLPLAALKAQAQEPIRIAFIDPLTGTFAAQGESGLHQLRFAADYLVNSQGGILGGREIEIMALDNQASAQESQIQLRRAISRGARYVFSGNGSAAAATLSSAIERHNRRNPDESVLYLNHAAVDPALTQQDCNFWHFRFDAHADMKLDALTSFIADNEDIESVYIIGQDYSFGRVVSESTVRFLNEKRPDIEIAGNELHPIGQVRDFTPYVTKIVSSGADAVVTGNWGADMVSLARSLISTGSDIPIYTFYAAYDGITATLGEEGVDRIYLVHADRSNHNLNEERRRYTREFKERYPEDDLTQPRIANALRMLVTAMQQTGSTDPLDVALAMEDMRIDSIGGEEVWMRPDDHQAHQPLHISVQTDEGIEFDADNSGYGLRTVFTKPLDETIQDTQCRMRRPR
ncbi:MAG: branched-chain amino acid ABC transporter substrate-binding protein [Pseudohongiellaceae bacterium]